MSTNNLGVALVNYACFCCGKEVDNAIVINQRLTKEEADNVEQLHNKCVGYSDKICPDCQEITKHGLVVFEIDEKLSEPGNPYRTGKYWIIKDDCDFAQQLREKNFIINKFGFLFAFITKEAANEVGFL